MSIAVELGALHAEVTRYGSAGFFLTTGSDGRPHVSHVPVTCTADALRVSLGRSGARNIAASPLAVLLFAPIEAGGYSLIVDVVAHAEGDFARLTPERAVLHRPAPISADAPGGHDCRTV